ncbi:MAG: sterol desaturase family protein [Anaerolineae bacterium]
MSQAGHSDSKEPIRLFQSGVLESLTHVHPAMVAAVWAPVSAVLLLLALRARRSGDPGIYIAVAFLAGAFLWTLAEYVLHRFLFHFPARGPRQERLAFLIHGIHHAQPMVKTRLVMPPAVSVPLAFAFYVLFYLLAGLALGRPLWVAPLFSGFVAGYLAYDLTHYSLHHFRQRSGYQQRLRRHHMRHHTEPHTRFGVISSVWDRVFGTEPRDGATMREIKLGDPH